ncbi:hypothetical protein HRbin17_00704 [bacterium HR17]|jgi:hypothetical protein|uniref:Uncharacterized protein n=1 Tax=Candidatus Fervidibacter japonicus TaxID=2035412 RepID=A0A2H5XAL0_9BACT|nr:hypothetical protein HRbin17_00704 [bacterium HR17]
MKPLRRWLHTHILTVAIGALLAVSVSGWTVYRQYRSHQPSAGACCPLTNKYGPEGKMGGLLFEVGLKTLAVDAVHSHFGKKPISIQTVKVLDRQKGLVEVTAVVNGKTKHLQVDLRVPQGKVTEL